ALKLILMCSAPPSALVARCFRSGTKPPATMRTRRIAAPRTSLPRRGWWRALRSNWNAVLQIRGRGCGSVGERRLILPLRHVGGGCQAQGVPARRRLLPSEWAALLVLLVLWACGQGASPPPSGPPARIVSLAPSTTEIVFGLGGGDRVVGVCAQCDYPEAATRPPRGGGDLAPSVEAVLGQRPDLVMVVPPPGNRETLRPITRAGAPA